MSTSNESITLLLFAGLAQQAGESEISWPYQPLTLDELYAELCAHFKLPRRESRLRAAVNHHFKEWSDTYNQGDTIAFIPAVSGG